MRSALAAFVVGLLFALGLGISGMTQPQKVFGFLDIFGSWDPSLMFVMIGAIGVHALAYRLLRGRPTPLLAVRWYLPESQKLSPPLLLGALIFGVGWGLAGYCPGPALVSLGSFQTRPWLFVAFMIIGMGLYRLLPERWRRT